MKNPQIKNVFFPLRSSLKTHGHEESSSTQLQSLFEPNRMNRWSDPSIETTSQQLIELSKISVNYSNSAQKFQTGSFSSRVCARAEGGGGDTHLPGWNPRNFPRYPSRGWVGCSKTRQHLYNDKKYKVYFETIAAFGTEPMGGDPACRGGGVLAGSNHWPTFEKNRPTFTKSI